MFIDGDKTGEYLPLESTKSIESGSTVYFVYFDRQEGLYNIKKLKVFFLLKLLLYRPVGTSERSSTAIR